VARRKTGEWHQNKHGTATRLGVTRSATLAATAPHDRAAAPWLLDGPINGESFALYAEEVFAPMLSPLDLVVIDNLGGHNNKAVRRTNSRRPLQDRRRDPRQYCASRMRQLSRQKWAYALDFIMLSDRKLARL
jgi:hypothetical protein